MLYLWALLENLSSPSTAARSSSEKKHLCKGSGTCARLSAPLRPAHQLTAGTDAARILHPDGFLLLTGKKERRKGQDVLHVAQRGLSKVLGLGSGLDARQPKKAAGWARQRCAPTSPRSPAGCSSGNPPRAPRPTHRSRSPAPPSPGTGPIPKKGNAKEYSNYRTVALISHASKVMLKILQATLRQ